jgi:hypothetical protein
VFKQQRLHSDPLLAIKYLAKHNPDLFLEHGQSRPDPNFLDVLSRGYNCWQADAIKRIDPDNPVVPDHLRGNVSVLFAATTDANSPTHFPHQKNSSTGKGRWSCTCDRFRSTGKQCEHLWASGILAQYGAIGAYEAACDAGQLNFNPDSDAQPDNSGPDANASKRSQDEAQGDRAEDGSEEESEEESDEDDDKPPDHGLWDRDDDDDDAKGYWKTDIMENPSLKKLDTLEEKSFAKTSRRNCSPAPSPVPSTPPALEETSDDEAPPPATGSRPTANSSSANPPGPSPAVRPLHEGRNPPQGSKWSNKKKSSLGLSKKAEAASRPPSGIGNSGNTCYAASLLQILLRQPSWELAFEHASRKSRTLRESELGKQLEDVHQSLHADKTGVYPQLNEVMAKAIGQSSGQHDPSEIFRGLVIELDRLTSEDYESQCFQDLFAASTRLRHLCSSCSQWSINTGGSSTGEYTEIVAFESIRQDVRDIRYDFPHDGCFWRHWQSTVHELQVQSRVFGRSRHTVSCTGRSSRCRNRLSVRYLCRKRE